MKKTIVLSIATLAMLGACNSSSNKSEQSNANGTTQVYNLDTTKLKPGDIYYQCEMPPAVISDKSGNCPKCNMELVEMKKK